MKIKIKWVFIAFGIIGYVLYFQGYGIVPLIMGSTSLIIGNQFNLKE